ncbi:MAG: hypothetical protein ACKO8T_07445, partial [Actinomycetota bacterium]
RIVGFGRRRQRWLSAGVHHHGCCEPGGDPSGSLGRLSIIGRFGTVQEIASAAMWLSCDESTYTFGHILGVDGAYLSR